MVFSSTKSLAAIAMAGLVDDDLVHYEDKVAAIWPEFAKHGKGEVRVQGQGTYLLCLRFCFVIYISFCRRIETRVGIDTP